MEQEHINGSTSGGTKEDDMDDLHQRVLELEHALLEAIHQVELLQSPTPHLQWKDMLARWKTIAISTSRRSLKDECQPVTVTAG